MDYQPTLDSVKQHPLPQWYDQAKFGIFIHWGTYSVPGWAPTGFGVQDMLAGKSGSQESPYAEWYWSNLHQPNSLTRAWQAKTYGPDFQYEQFAPMFNKAMQPWDPDAWAGLFKKAGARYVVLTTKHHEGFTLWQSQHPNPHRANYFAERDIVGELSSAVRAQGLRMGLYYSGGLDWTFKPMPILQMVDTILAMPQDQDYVGYCTAQFKELIERYQPQVLWNDIGMPDHAKVWEIFADYYNHIPEGVVNNRWGQYHLSMIPSFLMIDPVKKVLSDAMAQAFASGNIPSGGHADFDTPEYATYDKIVEKKWEATRGIGHSFGYNRNETEADYTSVPALVHMLVDIVSKNGNLLLNVGPMADGTIPTIQQERLMGLGAWLDTYGEAIYDTHPWTRAEGKAQAGGAEIPVRFTQKDGSVYAALLGTPAVRELKLSDVEASSVSGVELLGSAVPVKWQAEGNDLALTLDVDPATVTRGADALAFKLKRRAQENVS